MTRRGLAYLLILVGCAASTGAAFLPWWRRDYTDPLTGPFAATVDGTSVAGALAPLALVSIAGLGAAAISRGVVRRVVAGLVAVAGVGSIAAAALGAVETPDAAFAAKLVRPASASISPELLWTAVILALGAGLAIAVGGALLAVVPDKPARRAATYASPAVRRDAARTAAHQAGTAEADQTQWWQSLDAGVDPTDGPDRE